MEGPPREIQAFTRLCNQNRSAAAVAVYQKGRPSPTYLLTDSTHGASNALQPDGSVRMRGWNGLDAIACQRPAVIAAGLRQLYESRAHKAIYAPSEVRQYLRLAQLAAVFACISPIHGGGGL